MKNKEDLKFVDSLYSQANSSVKFYVYILFFAIILLFSSAIYWSSWAKVDELARSQGKVIPSSKIQTIQSFDGGIIDDILVKEGANVVKNQALINIDTTRFKASLDENYNILMSLLGAKTRLTAEMNLDVSKKVKKLKFDKALLKYENIIKEQNLLYTSRFNEHKANIDTLTIKYLQKKQELMEIKSKIKHLKNMNTLIEKEIKTIEQLVKRKARSNIDLIHAKKEFNRSYSEYKSILISIPRVKLAVKEAKNNIEVKSTTFKSEVAKELETINSNIRKYESIVVSEKDKLKKTVIVSPVNGIVKLIHQNTVGGVIRSGSDLIDIIPQSDILLIEAKLNPKDIAFINPKQKAIVKFTAYDFSIYGALSGKIIEISADSIVDKDSKNKDTYYKVVIKTDMNYLQKDGIKYPIIPGMITSVDIITGKKSILDFLLKPILKTKEAAFHER